MNLFYLIFFLINNHNYDFSFDIFFLLNMLLYICMCLILNCISIHFVLPFLNLFYVILIFFFQRKMIRKVNTGKGGFSFFFCSFFKFVFLKLFYIVINQYFCISYYFFKKIKMNKGKIL